MHRGENKVAFVLAIIVIGHDNDLTAGESVDYLRDTCLGHGMISQAQRHQIVQQQIAGESQQGWPVGRSRI